LETKIRMIQFSAIINLIQRKPMKGICNNWNRKNR
jgi:hypothetical protein